MMSVGSQIAVALRVRFGADESGQDLIEYALLTAIIGIVGFLVMSTFSNRMGTAYSGWNTAAQTAWQPCPPQPAACP
jgi:Flp pilus assembly pilin Flp